MFVIKYVSPDDSFTYSPLDPECKELRFGDRFTSQVKAINFLKKNIFLEGVVPDKYKAVHVYEVSGSYSQTKKSYFNKNYKN